MTVIILYKRHYIVQRHNHLILSFALRHHVSLRCVLELPILLSNWATFWRTVLHRTQSEISLTLDPPGEGLPDGTTLNEFRLLFHPAFPTIYFIFSFVDRELNPLWKGTTYNNIVLKERFLQT